MNEAPTTQKKSLTGDALKNVLWDTLNEIRSGETTPQAAIATAYQSREIMRVIRTEIQITTLVGEKPSVALTEFAGI